METPYDTNDFDLQARSTGNYRMRSSDDQGDNEFLYSLLFPQNKLTMIPDLNMTPAIKKRVEGVNLMIFNPNGLDEIIIFPFHNRTLQSRRYVKDPVLGFIVMIAPIVFDQDIADDYSKFRTVSMAAVLKGDTISTSGAPLGGTLNSVIVQSLPQISTLDFNKILPSAYSDANKRLADPLYEGVVMLAPLIDEHKFKQISDQFNLTKDELVRTTTVVPFTAALVANVRQVIANQITNTGMLPPNCRGHVTTKLKCKVVGTGGPSATYKIELVLKGRNLSSTYVLQDEVGTTDTTETVGGADTRTLYTEGNFDFWSEIDRWELALTSTANATILTESNISFEFDDVGLNGEIFPAGVIALTGLAPLQKYTISMLANLEVVPSQQLAKELQTGYDYVNRSNDLIQAKNAIRQLDSMGYGFVYSRMEYLLLADKLPKTFFRRDRQQMLSSGFGISSIWSAFKPNAGFLGRGVGGLVGSFFGKQDQGQRIGGSIGDMIMKSSGSFSSWTASDKPTEKEVKVQPKPHVNPKTGTYITPSTDVSSKKVEVFSMKSSGKSAKQEKIEKIEDLILDMILENPNNPQIQNLKETLLALKQSVTSEQPPLLDEKKKKIPIGKGFPSNLLGMDWVDGNDISDRVAMTGGRGFIKWIKKVMDKSGFVYGKANYVTVINGVSSIQQIYVTNMKFSYIEGGKNLSFSTMNVELDSEEKLVHFDTTFLQEDFVQISKAIAASAIFSVSDELYIFTNVELPEKVVNRGNSFTSAVVVACTFYPSPSVYTGGPMEGSSTTDLELKIKACIDANRFLVICNPETQSLNRVSKLLEDKGFGIGDINTAFSVSVMQPIVALTLSGNVWPVLTLIALNSARSVTTKYIVAPSDKKRKDEKTPNLEALKLQNTGRELIQTVMTGINEAPTKEFDFTGWTMDDLDEFIVEHTMAIQNLQLKDPNNNVERTMRQAFTAQSFKNLAQKMVQVENFSRRLFGTQSGILNSKGKPKKQPTVTGKMATLKALKW